MPMNVTMPETQIAAPGWKEGHGANPRPASASQGRGHRSDEQLAHAAGRGDTAAFDALYQRHHQPLLAFARHMLGRMHDAEDVVQHTFLAADRAFRAGKVPKAVRAWLYTVARNRCVSVLRARRDDVALGGGECVSTDGLAAEVEQREELRALVADLRRLPDDQRAALLLAELGELTHVEVARVIGVRQGKVKALVFQAREALAAASHARSLPCRSIREELERRHRRGAAAPASARSPDAVRGLPRVLGAGPRAAGRAGHRAARRPERGPARGDRRRRRRSGGCGRGRRGRRGRRGALRRFRRGEAAHDRRRRRRRRGRRCARPHRVEPGRRRPAGGRACRAARPAVRGSGGGVHGRGARPRAAAQARRGTAWRPRGEGARPAPRPRRPTAGRRRSRARRSGARRRPRVTPGTPAARLHRVRRRRRPATRSSRRTRRRRGRRRPRRAKRRSRRSRPRPARRTSRRPPCRRDSRSRRPRPPSRRRRRSRRHPPPRRQGRR